ncbi:MAG TPA: hypothetical protein VJX71_01190 [Methylomirabilota bacterium]|nr:hypothetical protein [Methylomirabilota bacterium]
MGLLDDLSDLAKQFAAGKTAAADVHSAYDQVSRAVPQSSLVEGLTHAFNSDQTPPFAEMLSNLFSQSSPDQKAGLLNQIVATLGPNIVSQILAGTGGMGGLASVLSGGSVTPAQAQQISPEQVQVLAQNAEKKDPSIVNAAAGFYAQHPTLVKAIGAGALALLLSKISQARR